jgi:hypothetical protein
MSAVSAISAAGSSQTAGESKQQKITADLKALAVALAKGDKAGAQTAMKQLQIDSAGAAASSSSSGSQGSPEIAEVAAALKAGNLPAAQSAFAKFESNAASALQQGMLSTGTATGADGASSATQKSNGLDSSSAGTVEAGSTFSVVI